MGARAKCIVYSWHVRSLTRYFYTAKYCNLLAALFLNWLTQLLPLNTKLIFNCVN